MFVSKVLSEDSVENLCTLGRLVSTGDDLSDVKYVMPLSLSLSLLTAIYQVDLGQPIAE